MQKIPLVKAKEIEAQIARPHRTGPLSLLPTPLHCLSMPDEEQHIFNISFLWEIHRPLIAQFLAEATYVLFVQHDALRLRMIRSGNQWQGYLVPLDLSVPCTIIDLSDVPANRHSATIEKQVEDLQSTLDLSEGPLLRVAYFNLGEAYPGRLLFMVHHYISDAFSTKILLEDFFTAYEQLSNGQNLRLQSPSHSLYDYAERLRAYASSEQLDQEIDYWVSSQRRQVKSLPVDYPGNIDLPGEKDYIYTDWRKRKRACFSPSAAQG